MTTTDQTTTPPPAKGFGGHPVGSIEEFWAEQEWREGRRRLFRGIRVGQRARRWKAGR